MADIALCSQCGKDFEDREEIIAVTDAVISTDDDAIVPNDSEPWLALYHIRCCGGEISKVLGVESASSDKTNDDRQPN